MTFQQKLGVKGLQLVMKLWPSTPPKRVPNKAGYNQKNCKKYSCPLTSLAGIQSKGLVHD